MFHSIAYGFSCVKLPVYIKRFESSRLRTTHLDHLCFSSSIIPQNLMSSRNFESVSKQGFNSSFFYRAHLMWNNLPLKLREIVCPGEFKTALLEYLWKEDITAEFKKCLIDEMGTDGMVDGGSDLEN